MARTPERRQARPQGAGYDPAPTGLVAVLGGAAGDEDSLRAALLKMAAGLSGRAGDPPEPLIRVERRLGLAARHSHGDHSQPALTGRYLVLFDGRPRLAESRDLGPPDMSLEARIARALELWGWETTLERLDGPFAALIWDDAERRLTLLRDRFGQRPLYWGAAPDGALILGSTLRAVTGYPGFASALDQDAAAAYLNCGWVPSPRSLIANLRSLPAGWRADFTLGADGLPQPDARPWFTLDTLLPAWSGNLKESQEAEGADALERALLTGLEAGLAGSSAPGIVLSPAPQSMLLAGLYGASSGRKLRSLSFSFGDPRLDADDPTTEIAGHLGLDHRVEPLSAQALIELVVDLPVLFDEPIADPAALSTLYAAMILRQGCDTVLSGVGGDLLMGLRPLHHDALRLKTGYSRSAQRWLRLAPLGWMNTVSSQGRSLRLGDGWRASLRERAAPSSRMWLEEKRRLWRTVDRPMPEAPAGFLYPGRAPKQSDAQLAELILADAASELSDSTLPQIDRIMAAQRLGLAAPFLDVEAARASLALSGRAMGHRSGGVAMRRLLDRVLPTQLWVRAKAWPMPVIGDWLRGPLRGWAEELIRADRLAAEGLDPEPLRAAWEEHLRGQRDWGRELWAHVQLAAWCRRWGIG